MDCQQCGVTLTRPTQRAYCSQACWYVWRHAHGTKDYPRRGHVRLHRLIAEQAVGRALPPRAVVHHTVDKHDNEHLVICENQAYHMLLHARARVVAAGGNPNTERLCTVCRVLRPVSLFTVVQTGRCAGRTISTCQDCRRRKRREGLWT